MNENLNLVEILKDCPRGTKLYSLIFGEVELVGLNVGTTYPIVVKTGKKQSNIEDIVTFTSSGMWHNGFNNGECLLFPSKDQRDWSKFKVKTPKFDPNTLQPFDKVLVSDLKQWRCQFFSHIVEDEDNYPYACIFESFRYCIPYNDETKHLVGTFDEAPEFYRFWED